jgi:hypothetical protein
MSERLSETELRVYADMPVPDWSAWSKWTDVRAMAAELLERREQNRREHIRHELLVELRERADALDALAETHATTVQRLCDERDRLALKVEQYQRQLDDRWAGVVGVTNEAVAVNARLTAALADVADYFDRNDDPREWPAFMPTVIEALAGQPRAIPCEFGEDHAVTTESAVCRACWREAAEDATRTRTEVARLTAALARYGAHAMGGCEALRAYVGAPAPCTCGLDEARGAAHG